MSTKNTLEHVVVITNQYCSLLLSYSTVLGGLMALFVPWIVNAQGARCDPPSVLIGLDRSGSMDQAPGSQFLAETYPESKAGIAHRALNQAVRRFQNRVAFGMGMFPDGPDRPCTAGGNPFVGQLDNGRGRFELNQAQRFAAQISRHRRTRGGSTPLASSISVFGRWLQHIDGRRALIMVTDGMESCGRDPVERAALMFSSGVPVYVIGLGSSPEERRQLDRIAAAGGTSRAVIANDQSAIERTLNRILEPMVRETCNGLDDDCDGRIDEGFGVGGRCNTGEPGICEAGRIECRDGGSECIQELSPRAEICDSEDNDCDGLTDEGSPGGGQRCHTGALGHCAIGQTSCVDGDFVCLPSSAPSPELCDGIDNDCDGQADEAARGVGERCEGDGNGLCRGATQICRDGVLTCQAQVLPSPDICDGQDNDCDGRVDESEPQIGQICETEAIGVCGQGQFSCIGGRLTCQQIRSGSPERCDGEDNDCDGSVDEGNPGGGDACHTDGLGLCSFGIRTCEFGELTCQGPVPSQDDECDGEDNDCDGSIDEDLRVAEVCNTGRPGQCAEGVMGCGRRGSICQPIEEPRAEECDGLDNDCDGMIDEEVRNQCGFCGQTNSDTCNGIDDDCDGQLDESADCPGSSVCTLGRCTSPCDAGECPEGLLCLKGACITECESLGCEPGLTCRASGCQDPCDGIACEPGEECHNGRCSPGGCPDEGCEENELCLNEQCVPHLCHEVHCETGDYCRVGECIPSCARISCPFESLCIDGACVERACQPGDCPTGQHCIEGLCAVRDCPGGPCEPGETCMSGQCERHPCVGVECPSAEVCVIRMGTAQCVFGEPGGQATEPENVVQNQPERETVLDIPIALDPEPYRRNQSGDGSPDGAERPIEQPDDSGCSVHPTSESYSGIWFYLFLAALAIRRKVFTIEPT